MPLKNYCRLHQRFAGGQQVYAASNHLEILLVRNLAKPERCLAAPCLLAVHLSGQSLMNQLSVRIVEGLLQQSLFDYRLLLVLPFVKEIQFQFGLDSEHLMGSCKRALRFNMTYYACLRDASIKFLLEKYDALYLVHSRCYKVEAVNQFLAKYTQLSFEVFSHQ